MKIWLALVCLLFTFSLHAEIKVLAFAGSTRNGSYNKKLVQEAAQIASKFGADVTMIDLKDYPMPLYDGDLLKMPENAKSFRTLMIENDAIIIASPQYNASVPAVLKNALDWASMNEERKRSSEAFLGKKFALMSASPGKKGGAQGLAHLRAIIEECGGDVIPMQVSLVNARQTLSAIHTDLDYPPWKKELIQEVQALLQSITPICIRK